MSDEKKQKKVSGDVTTDVPEYATELVKRILNFKMHAEEETKFFQEKYLESLQRSREWVDVWNSLLKVFNLASSSAIAGGTYRIEEGSNGNLKIIEFK